MHDSGNDRESPASRWRRAEKVYLAVVEQAAGERPHLLDALCGDDAVLRHEVETLLAHTERARRFIETPAAIMAAQLMADSSPRDLVGRLIGEYTVTAPLGAGGMGEVYRARDSRLGRDVAIKVLPASVARNPERLARFEREARILASLNHPHVATLHGVAETDDVLALVMELIEGPTLAERLDSGPLPLAEALDIARQIADALDAAHERGIIHRDLKPSNIKVTEGRVKVLDFGLAKLIATDHDQPPIDDPAAARPDQLRLPTTRPGLLLGTAPYMSPEQLRGPDVSKQTDIWAFGCVLFEMLSGHRAFDGATGADVTAAILSRDPDWRTVPAYTPPDVVALVRHCLEKDVRHRLRDIADSRRHLVVAPSSPASVTRSRRAARLISGGIAAAVLVSLVWAWSPRTRITGGAAPPIEFSVDAPPSAAFAAGRAPVAISSDGRRIVFVAAQAAGASMLWLKESDSANLRSLAGTEGATFPFWSPDGQSVGFFARGELKRLDLDSGMVTTICPAASGAGGTWNVEDTIVFAPYYSSSLYRVSAAGGTPEPVTRLDQSRGEASHILPRFLPDGRHFLYLSRPDSLYVASLDGMTPKHLLDGTSHMEYAAGSLLFVHEASLVAHPFDLSLLELTGPRRVIATGLAVAGAGDAPFSASDSTLVFRTGMGATRELTWMDRGGKRLGTVGLPDEYYYPALSPDERHIAVEIARGTTHEVWVFESQPGSNVGNKIADDRHMPLWSPDNERLLLLGSRPGGLYERAARGLSTETTVWKSAPAMALMDRSGDNRLLFSLGGDALLRDLLIIAIPPGGAPDVLARTPFGEAHGRFSPRGDLVAYTRIDPKERGEVFVRELSSERSVQISATGGAYPVWRPDQGELFFIAADGWLTAVRIVDSRTFDTAHPLRLFQMPEQTPPNRASFAVSRDGRRFLVNASAPGDTLSPWRVVLNWTSLRNPRS